MVENRPWLTILTHVTLIAGLIIVLFPVWIAFVASTYPPETFISGVVPLLPGSHLIENYREVLSVGAARNGLPPVLPMLLNSLVMALGIAFGKIVISLLSAFAIVYFRFPFRMAAFWIIFMTLMLPVEVRIVPTYQVIADLNMLNSYAGLTIPLIASATATFLYRQFFLTVPDELVEAARIDGAGPWKFLKDIAIPLSRTSTAALFVILFIYGWNQYLWPLLVTTDPNYYTVVMGIQRLMQALDNEPLWNLVMAVAILAILPPVIVVMAMQKLFVRGLVESEK
ncbi:sn-glycerol-3-phosphate ABC transporter permease UgpE [Jiella sp. MQZ9-1]|uniref:sn-glycerol-3-phosphate transport system permease protein UgpE n=1 Tax=Jiella flava TaxID=2816857 RepID=A0A939FZM8_9HYPH|nr:sn-glycerol-3-phosphate ABC transporter permease UgpE [Jiella flava]MBO0662923.1 sn-glycerol-3-phosphate ABC transporter permease UgpE [Jiella flava]MCD2471317.1 sn-glycerol-3-phosphate ABC transporter permease UgpE [Jiella flava]